MESPPTNEVDHPPMLSLPEAAAMLRCHPNTVRAWVRQGKLVSIPMGPEKVGMFLLADVERLKKPLERVGVIVKEDKHAFPVVGIGASAGGLDAISRLLQHLPTDLGLAYVFVTHQEKEQEKTLADVLRKKTAMPVFVVENGMKLDPDRLYVAPADMHTAVVNSTFMLQQPRGVNDTRIRPIDTFFTALANEYQNNAIGIVLSGGGMDGTEGLRAIKAEDGLTIVQDHTAKDPSMPQSAQEAEVVDLVRAPEDIARELVQLVKELFAGGAARIPSKHDNEIRRILHYLLEQRGIDFTEYKEATIHRRIIRRMVLSKCNKLSDYATLLRGTPTEVDTLCNDLLINVTSFFRDPAFHKALTEKVFPELFGDRTTIDPLRIWVAACAGGEEVVSIAITLLEFLGDRAATTPVQIFATDLNERTIEKARIGVYKKSALQDLDPALLAKYFMHVDGHYQVIKPIRDLCVFAKHDLLKDPPFSRVDLISCQNVLIYLENAAQARVLKSFHYALKTTGYLALGKSETTGTAEGYFTQPDRDHKVHQKKRKGGARLPADLHFKPGTVGTPSTVAPPPQLRPIAAHTDLDRTLEQVLLQRYVPASVLVNKDLEIVRFMGGTAPFLSPGSGRASLNLLKMVRDDLAFELRSLLQRVRKEKIAVRKSGIPVRLNTGLHDVALEVVPMGDARDQHYLVLFKEEARATEPAPSNGTAKRGNDPRDKRISALEQELREAREQMRLVSEESEISNQELQAANEEVVSSNEELQSINEELETSKEELQSINEEYATINEELRLRNDALQESEERLRLATKTGKVGLWDWDIPGDQITWSDSLYEIHGVKKERFEATVQGFAQLVHADDRERVQEAIDHAILHDAKYEIEFRAVRPDGGIFWQYTNAAVVRVDGRAVRMLGATLDITERKRAEAAVRTRAEALEVLNNASDTLIAELDSERIAQSVTDAGLALSGANMGAFFYQTTDELGEVTPRLALAGLSISDFTNSAQTTEAVRASPTYRGEVLVRVADTRKDTGHKGFDPFQQLTKGHAPARSLIALPVTSRNGKVLGAFFFGHPEPERFTQETEDLLSALAAQTALAVDNADLHNALQRELEQQRVSTLALQQAHEKLNNTLGSITDGLAVLDSEWRYTYFSEQGGRILGIASEAMLGKVVWDVFPAALGTKFETCFRLAVETGKTQHFEEYYPAPLDKWLELHCYPSALGLSVYFQDISERKKGEDRLRETQERLSLALDSAELGTWNIDGKVQNMTTDERFNTIFGWGEKTIDVEQAFSLLHPDDRERIREAIAATTRPVDTQPYDVEYRVVHPDGSIHWILAKGRSTFTDGPNGKELLSFDGTVMDITERKKAEAALAESETRYRKLIETLPAAVFTCDADGKILLYNEACSTLWGQAPDPKADLWNGAYAIFTKDGEPIPRELSPMAVAVKEGRSVRDEIIIQRKDGSRRNVLVHPEPLFDAAGAVIGGYNVLIDITERHREEAERQQLLGMLERSLNEIYIFDLKSLKFEYVNHGALGNLGYSLQQMRDMTPLDIKPEFSARQFNALVKPLRNGEKEKLLFYTVHRRADGTDYPVEVHLQIVNNGPRRVFMAMILDITERKLHEERLRVLTGTGKLGIWDWDIVADTITWTDPVYEIHGVAKDSFDLTMKGYAALIHPDDRERVTAAIKAALEEDAPYELEFRTLNGEGVVNWVFTNAVVMREGGQPVRMMGGTMNINQRKEAEEAARRLAAIVESSEDAIITKGLDGILNSWNKGAERMFGYTAEEIIGRPNTVLFPEERREEERALFERLKQGDRIEHYESVRLHKNGSSVHVALTLSPLKNESGEVIGASKVIRDITAHKQAQEAIRASEARFHLLADNVAQLIWTAEADGSAMWFNKRWEEFTGMTGEEIRLNAKDLHHPDHYDRVNSSLKARAEKGEHWEDTFPLKGKDGQFRWFLSNAMPIKDKNGRVVRWFGTCTDITNEREAQERFRLLADNIGQLAWIAEPNGDIHWYNKRWFEYSGTTLEEMRGWGWQKIHHPDHVDRVTEKFREHILGERDWEDTFPIRSAKGEYRWFLSRAFPVRDSDGKVLRWFGTNTDVTEERAAREELQQSEERFRLLADHMSQMAYTADANGVVTWVNRRWLEYTGLAVESMNQGGWGTVVDPDQYENMVASYAEASRKGVPWEHIFRLRSKQGEYRWFLSRSMPIKSADGVVERWFGTNTDITEQKLAEEALEESARHKDHFLATLAHELRNPLAPLKNGLQLMELAPDDQETMETTRAMMVRQLDHMVRLVDDLMDLSRISRGKIDLLKADIELRTVVATALEASKPLIERNGHRLQVELTSDALMVHGDADRLTQVVSNLLNNAAKYTPAGGHIDLWVGAEKEGGVIRVKDNGIGIDPAALPKVFDMFAQVDPNQKAQAGGGLGIGLNVVQRLVRMHNGEVEGRSEGLGKGSEFIVRLPLIPVVEKPKAREEATRTAISSRRVLVVDDNEDIALSMSLLLRKTGHVVAVAHDGEHAVVMAETFRPDVILMDIGMPRMNGYEACAAIRATEPGKRIHIIAVSGWGQEEDRNKSRDAGFDGHVVKPMERATLERVILEATPYRA